MQFFCNLIFATWYQPPNTYNLILTTCPSCSLSYNCHLFYISGCWPWWLGRTVYQSCQAWPQLQLGIWLLQWWYLEEDLLVFSGIIKYQDMLPSGRSCYSWNNNSLSAQVALAHCLQCKVITALTLLHIKVGRHRISIWLTMPGKGYWRSKQLTLNTEHTLWFGHSNPQLLQGVVKKNFLSKYSRKVRKQKKI